MLTANVSYRVAYLMDNTELDTCIGEYALRQFGIRKFPKKLVISPLLCNFMSENQQLTNMYSDDYH